MAFLCITCNLAAQQTNAGKKEVTEPSGSKPGFKNQSPPATSTENKSTSKPAATVPPGNHKTATDHNPVSAADVAKASEIIRVDYINMPADVQARINNNKAQGKYLLEGIAKSFLVEIKTCLTDADREKTLSFLKTNKGFINSQFIAAGQVKIFVEPSFDSAELKEAMAGKGIHFNFLNRSYLLKN